MFFSAEQTRLILEQQRIMRSGKPNGKNLCQYGELSCVRCCLPHIGGDSHLAGPESSDRYLGPGGLVMKFRNFNPLHDPRIEASQYEDSFTDVGRAEMERRFSERRSLFLRLYDRKEPRRSLSQYMKAARQNEGYRFQPQASAGPASLYIAGSVGGKGLSPGELPECHLLGFLDSSGKVGCLAHPLAETSLGFDGRDYEGFFHHTGCCGSVGCEASREFEFLSAPALAIFSKAVSGMSWYEYSRHATSVLVYYLRGFDFLLKMSGSGSALDQWTLPGIVEYTNSLYDEWPFRGGSEEAEEMAILTMDIPLDERILYVTLGTVFTRKNLEDQLLHARRLLKSLVPWQACQG